MAYSSWILPTAVMCSLTGRWAARAKHGATGYHAARLRIALGRLHFTLIAASVSVFPLAVQADPTGGGGAPSSPATLLPPGPLHTKHSQIVDQYDRPVRLTCTGLYGPDTKASGIAPPSWTVDRLGGLRGHGKFLGRLLLIVDGRLVSNR
jgi:hypothetical protein